MARIVAITGALFKAFRRSSQSLGSFASNNFFLMSLYFLRQAGIFVYLIAGFVMLFPLSTDPLRKAPPDRLSLWPLTRSDLWILRIVSPWLNPMTWMVAVLAIWMLRGKISVGLCLALGSVFAIGFVASSLPLEKKWGIWRRIPDFPGPLNHLIRKNLREMLSTLDVYAGLLLSLSFLAARIAGLEIPPQAYVAVTIVVVLALSSYAQCLFGLDRDDALTRYRLLPLRGWQVLVAKDVPFLVIVLLLTLPVAPLSGLAAALMALAAGHVTSIQQPSDQTRWRFTSGSAIGMGLIQVVLMTIAAGTVSTMPLLFGLTIAAFLISMFWYGSELDKHPL